MPTRYCLLTRRRPAHFRQPWTRSDDWKSYVEPPPCIAVHHNRCPGKSCWTAFGRHWSDSTVSPAAQGSDRRPAPAGIRRACLLPSSSSEPQLACVTEVAANQIATTRGALLPTEVRKAERKLSSETACK